MVTNFILWAIHTDGLGHSDYTHLDDDERDQLLSDDRFVTLVTSKAGGDEPIVVGSDVEFTMGLVLQKNLTILRTVVRRAIVKRIQIITQQNGQDVFIDVLERLEQIERTVNVNNGTLETYELELAQAMILFNNTADMAEAICSNYTDLVALEEQQQIDLTAQDIRISDLENSLNATFGPGANLTLTEAYNVTELLALYEQLEDAVNFLEVDVNTLLSDAQMLQNAVTDFLNNTAISGNSTLLLSLIINETVVLTGQIGTLFNESEALAGTCTNSSTNATSLLSQINARITQLNFTQLTVINETLIQAAADLDAIIALLATTTNETNTHTNLISQLSAYNTSVQAAKLAIETLTNETRGILDAVNTTAVGVSTVITTTNTTLQTFITTVETFVNSSNAALLANLTAANTTLFEQYALLITNYTTLDARTTEAALNLTDLWARTIIAQSNVTLLETNVNTLDGDIGALSNSTTTLSGQVDTLLLESTWLEGNATTLASDLQTLNTSFVTLDGDAITANNTANAQELLIDDHLARIEVLEALATTLNGTTSAAFFTKIEPTLVAGDVLSAGNVVSMDETGRVVRARGLRETDRFTFAQQFNSSLVGDVLTVGASDDINSGAATAIDAMDNMFMTLNYGGNAVEFEGVTLQDTVPSIITDNRDRIYSGVGDVLVIKYSAAQRFVWMVAVDSALSATISGMAVDPTTQNLWVSGSVLSTGGSIDFGLAATSRDVVFRDASHNPVYTHQLGVGASDVLDNVAIGFFGSITQSGEWAELHIMEADGYSGSGADFAVLNDIDVTRKGEVYACGFYNRDVSAQTISWFQVNLASGTTTLVSQLARSRADLTIPSILAVPYVHAISRGSGMFLKYVPTGAIPGTVSFWRADEGTDVVAAPGVQQAPMRFVHVAVDQADNVFLQGWHGYDSEADPALDALYDLQFTLDASNAATVTVNVGREEERRLTLVIARIDPVDGDYRWIATDITTASSNGEFKLNHRFSSAPTNSSKQIYNLFDPAYQSDIMLTHRGDVVFVGRANCNPTSIANLALRYTMDSAETGNTLITCTAPSHFIFKFEGLSGQYMQHVSDSAGEFINPSRAVIGPDSYIWYTYRTLGDANLDGSGVLSPAPGALSVDYFYKLDPEFNVLWGVARSSEVSFVQEVSGFMVDRRRNLWYIEDIYSGAQNVNVTQFPDFEPSSLAFGLVRNVDMTHMPIGIVVEGGVANDPVRVVMEGIVDSNLVPTIQGRNYCNFHGVLQTSRCYSMPSMGFAPANGSIVVDIHRDALRIPTGGRGVY